MELVSVVIANWNGMEYVGTCLERVFRQTYSPIEVVVVDNGSTDGSSAFIKARYPQVFLIKNCENRGFAAGYNAAIKASRGTYVLALNTDVFVEKTFVSEAVKKLRLGERIGAVAPKILQHGTGHIQYVGVYLRKRISMVNSDNCDREELVFGTSGAAVLYRREMLEGIKLFGEYFDETYFSFGEDIDLSWRAQLYGWKAVYAPEAVAHHVGSGSLQGRVRLVDKPAFFQRHVLKNRYMTITKNCSLGIFLYLFPYLLLTEVLTWPYFLMRTPLKVPYLLLSIYDYFHMLPSTLMKRAVIHRNRKVDDRYIRQFFRGF